MKVMINADDFGFNESCSKAIIKAFEKGYITTTTACANGDFFEEAVQLAKQKGFQNAIGIHFNLTELKPLTEDILQFEDFCENGCFIYKFNRNKPLSNEKKEAVYKELTAQAIRYKQSGLPIHHVDSHHHIHNAPAIFPIFMRVVEEQGITHVRQFQNIGNLSLVKKLAKGIYNFVLKRKGLTYSKSFGSFDDFVKSDISRITNIEIMVHPDFQNGKLIDRDSDSDYSNPHGKNYDEMVEVLTRKGVSVENIIGCG